MGILTKLIGLFFLIILFFVVLNSKTLLPRISNWIVGPEKTPYQIGASYINEIYKVPSYTGENINDYQSRFATFTSGQKAMKALTVTKAYNTLTLVTESVTVPVDTKWVFWLTNTPDIGNKTKYINFGKIVQPYSFRQYVTEINPNSVDLIDYKYVMIVDPATYQVYSLWTLNNN